MATHYCRGERFASMVEQCRQLRRSATRGERVLWSRLRDRRLDGFKFRRQHQFGPFILDFYCAELRLAIEIDGPSHNPPNAQARDRNRDAYLLSAGVRVLHLSEDLVIHRVGAALSLINDECAQLAIRRCPRRPRWDDRD